MSRVGDKKKFLEYLIPVVEDPFSHKKNKVLQSSITKLPLSSFPLSNYVFDYNCSSTPKHSDIHCQKIWNRGEEDF